MSFTFTKLAIPDIVLIKFRRFEDHRGFFAVSYQEDSLRQAGINADFVQDNHSFSKARVLRGMHFQRPPFAQGKLICVLQGDILDVAVDLRENSPTFGRWVSAELSCRSDQLIWIPPGFAHGFLTLSSSALIQYKCTQPYAPEYEDGFRWDDPTIAIDWPFRDVIVSDRDAALPLFNHLNGRGHASA